MFVLFIPGSETKMKIIHKTINLEEKFKRTRMVSLEKKRRRVTF